MRARLEGGHSARLLVNAVTAGKESESGGYETVLTPPARRAAFDQNPR